MHLAEVGHHSPTAHYSSFQGSKRSELRHLCGVIKAIIDLKTLTASASGAGGAEMDCS